MEIIRKKTGIDKCRSHHTGILPYIPYNGTPMKTLVKGGSVNGNYGQYVCDFVIYSGYTSGMTSEIMTGSSMTYQLKKEIMRYRYLDIIRKYNFIKKRLRDGIYARRHIVELPGIGTISAWTTTEITGSTCGVIEDGLASRSKYAFTPAEVTDFIFSEGLYTYKGDDSRILSEDYLVLVRDCDKIIEYNEEWNEWWTAAAELIGITDYELKVRFFGEYTRGDSVSEFIFPHDVDLYILGLIEVLSDIKGARVPAEISYTAINSLLKWFDRNRPLYEYAKDNPTDENEKIVNLWREKGGDEFYEYLKGLTAKWIKDVSPSWAQGPFPSFASPVIEYDVLTVNDAGYERLYTPYEYSVEGDETVSAVREYEVPVSGMGSGLRPGFVEYADGEEPVVESMLETVQSPEKMRVSDGIVGIFDKFSDSDSGLTGQLYECRYASANRNELPVSYKGNENVQVIFDHISGNTHYYWLCSASTASLPCGDDESIGPNVRKYRNVAILSTIPYVINPDGNHETNPVEIGDTYYFMAAFKNGVYGPYGAIDSPSGEISYLRLPYNAGERLNITSYVSGTSYSQSDFDGAETTYDMVSSIVRYDSEVTIEYVIGATSGASSATTGIHYREVIPYETGRTTVSIDNVYMGEIYYEKADNESIKEYVYSDEYRLYRLANRAKITGMEVATLWTEWSINTPLITRDGTEGLMEEPKYDVEVEYNRGAAAAWENHFKLSECNTMEDLEKYGNNVFNL